MKTIYIGASNHKLGLIQYTIYTEKPVLLIENLKATIPAIERLFVSIDEFIEVEKDIDKPETLIGQISEQVRKAGREVKK